MRILFVAYPFSIHSARWVSQVAGQGWDIHLFPSSVGTLHSEFRDITYYDLSASRPKGADRSVRVRGLLPLPRGSHHVISLMSRFRMPLVERAFWLAQVIRRVKPDIIHSLELQHAGYLTLDARKRIGGAFPTWMVTNWGSDIYLFRHLAEHEEKIRSLLGACDYYACECERDVELAREYGFQGSVVPVWPIAGGFDLAHLARFREPGPVSGRKLIILKGYQGWAGRALVGLRALEMCADVLQGFRIGVYVANPDVQLAARLIAQRTGLSIEIIPASPHDKILELFGSARIYMGLSISDGISTSLLEAMVMGAFPIQSCTACADEWIVPGETGLTVPPEDPQAVAAAIRRAVADDALVDEAAVRNLRVAEGRLDRRVIQPQVISTYRRVAAESSGRR